MSREKTFVLIRIYKSNKEINRLKRELDSDTTIAQIFDLVQKEFKYQATSREWSCFSETLGINIDDLDQSIGQSEEMIVLKITIPDEEKQQIDNSQEILTTEAFPQVTIKTEIALVKNNKTIDTIYLEIDNSVIVKEIFEIIQKQRNCDLSQIHYWTCYTQMKKFKPEDSPNENFLIIDISVPIHINLQIMDNELEQFQERVKFKDALPITEIFSKIKDDFNIQTEIAEWTCHSKRYKTYLSEEEIIEQQYDNDTFIINVAQNAKCQLLQRLSQRNKVQQSENNKKCQVHQNNLIKFICTEKECNLRKLCHQCLNDLHDQSHKKSNLLRIEEFSSKVTKQIDALFKQRDQYNSLKQKLLNWKVRMEQLMEQYCSFFQILYNFEEESIKIANNIQNKLKYECSWLKSDSFIEEMVYMFSSEYIKKQEIINEANLFTAQQNLIKFESFFNDFQQKVYYLDFQTIPEFNELNLSTQESPLKYDGKYLDKLSMEDFAYGKYLIQHSDLKIEIFNSEYKKIDVAYDIKDKSTLQDVKDFVQNQILKIQNVFEFSTCRSVVQNRRLTDQTESIYPIIKKDIIQVILPRLVDELKNIKIIDLEVHLKNGFQSRKIRQSCSSQYTLEEIEIAVLNYCNIAKDQNIEVYFELCNQTYLNQEKRQQSLQKLQLTSKPKITVHIRKKDFQRNNPPLTYPRPLIQDRMITLQCVIQDGRTQIQLPVQQSHHNCLQDLVKIIEDYCNLNLKVQTIDIFIDQKGYNDEQRRKTFKELKIDDFKKIDMRIRWAGG